MIYEYHHYRDSKLKIIFHTDTLGNKREFFRLHWHRNPEFLYFLKGNGTVKIDGVNIPAREGDLVCINSNCIHSVKPLSEVCSYHCLIVDESILPDVGVLSPKINDAKAKALYLNIVDEYTSKPSCYRDVIKGYIMSMVSLAMRESRQQTDTDILGFKPKYETVKAVIGYMYENFQNDVSLESAAAAAGVSKYYLCHLFKEVTGSSFLSHLNYIRCNNAHTMLSTGKYSVSECAYSSGFSNLSYFSATYKRIMGVSPVKDLKTADE